MAMVQVQYSNWMDEEGKNLRAGVSYRFALLQNYTDVYVAPVGFSPWENLQKNTDAARDIIIFIQWLSCQAEASA